MKKINTNEAMEINGGKTMNCKICGTRVGGNFWTKYWHCVKHSWKAVMPAVEFVALCFGLAAL